MLRLVIDKEIRDILGSTKFALTFAACAFLILLSFVVGAANFKSSQARNDAARAENLRRLEGVTDWMAVFDTRVFLPPMPLATLVSGVSNDVGRTTEVRARGEMTTLDSRYNEEPMLAMFRFLDLEFIFQVVLSLFAILFGYDAICGEKERGTLRLNLANSIPRSTLILGKLIGSYLALGAALVLALGVSSLMLPLLGVKLTGDEWSRLGLVTLTGLLYFGVFLSLSTLVSAIAKRSSSSFMVSLVIWILAVMVIPRTAVLVAGRAVDVPSVDELSAQKANYASDLWRGFKSDMAEFKTPETEDVEAMMGAFNTYMDSLNSVRDKKMDAFTSRLNEQRTNRQAVQRAYALNLARLSPATSLTLATSELAGTSLALKDDFRKSAQDYQTSFGKFISEKTGMKVGGRMMVVKFNSDDEDEEEKPIDPSELPEFQYRQPSTAQVIGKAAVDIGLLAGLQLLFFLGSVISFNRYDAR